MGTEKSLVGVDKSAQLCSKETMTEDAVKALDPEHIDSLDDLNSFRVLIRQLQLLVATLNALVADLRSSLAEKDAEIAELKKALFGQKSERQVRMGPAKPKTKLSKAEDKRRRQQARGKAKQNRDERNKKLVEQTVEHPAPKSCPSCHSQGPFITLSPDISTEVEYLGERLFQLLHRIEKNLCECGHIFSGEGVERVTEGTHYGPAMHANVVVSKCADAMPLNRLSKRFARDGLHVARSTLTDIFHRSASLLEPIHARLVQMVATATIVNADETSQPVMDKDKCRKGYIWTFIAHSIIAYVFSATRSGETAERVLAGTIGKLQVDAYTGYNSVCMPEGRERVGCMAHCRRYFHKARDQCPDEANFAIGQILELYRIEYEAAEKSILGTETHRLLRVNKSQPILDELKVWLEANKGLHTPKSPLGKALRYALRQWGPLTTFVSDPSLRLDNNISEGALRIIAQGRDNFRWVGNNQAGKNLAIAQTIVATCIKNNVNPQHYITDVLIRLQTHPAKRIDELLPMNWTPQVS